MAKDRENQIIVKKVVSNNPKAPKWRAEITIDGQKYKAGLWVWTRKDGSEVTDNNGNQQMIGEIEVDDYEDRKAQQQPTTRGQSTPPPLPKDQADIPF